MVYYSFFITFIHKNISKRVRPGEKLTASLRPPVQINNVIQRYLNFLHIATLTVIFIRLILQTR